MQIPKDLCISEESENENRRQMFVFLKLLIKFESKSIRIINHMCQYRSLQFSVLFFFSSPFRKLNNLFSAAGGVFTQEPRT